MQDLKFFYRAGYLSIKEGPVKCAIVCNKSLVILQQVFVTSFTLDLHMKANHKERQSVICSICKVELRDKYSLKKHMSTVHGESKNLCTTCGKKFKAKDYLKKHMLKGRVGN